MPEIFGFSSELLLSIHDNDSRRKLCSLALGLCIGGEVHKVSRYENMVYKKGPQCNYWGPFLP